MHRYMPWVDSGMDSGLPFMKMHGLGNDFVIFDERAKGSVVSAELAIAMADRHIGVGFDQLVAIRHSEVADLELVFWNADGSTAGACGNATRCVAGWEMSRMGVGSLTLRTERGILQATKLDGELVEVNMGAPLIGWQDIPLAREMDTLHLPLEGDPVATGMGNPHCTFFVDDLDAIQLDDFGPYIENDPLFPQRTNVQIAQIVGPDHVRMRVWERGVGVTLASGSSSCAVTVAAVRRGLTSPTVTLDLDGGRLTVAWRDAGVFMAGPWAHVFDGVWRGPR